MIATPSNLDRVAASMRGPIRQYVDVLNGLAGENMEAITLFGAIVTGPFDRALHTARNVLVLGKVDLDVLRRLAEHGARLGKARIAAPLVMTPEYIRASLDTFPLELIEIKQHHLTILGPDHFDDLAFDDTHVRLQCEREFKVVLIGLRQGLLAAAGRRKVISTLETDVAEGLMRTLRGMLWLKGRTDGMPSGRLLDEMEKIVERKLSGVRTALDPSAVHDWDVFEALYRDVETLGQVVDEW